MKLSNIFKKTSGKTVKANVEKLDKKHLTKIIGGTDGTETEAELNARAGKAHFGSSSSGRVE